MEVIRPTTASLSASVSGRVVLVTGAASGIGMAIAQLLASHDAVVIACDLRFSEGTLGGFKLQRNIFTYQCDVTSWELQVKMFQWIINTFGRLDVCCPNAGIHPELAMASVGDSRENAEMNIAANWLGDHFDSGTEEQQISQPVDLVWEVNVKGVLFTSKLAIHHMKKLGGGKVIVTGSAGAYMGIAEQDMYAASKHALLGLTRSMAAREDLRAQDISISMISPWLTETPMVRELNRKLMQEARTSSATDVAWAVACLLSSPNKAINGKELWIQGQAIREVGHSYSQWLQHLQASQ